MDGSRFDALSRSLASVGSRRGVLSGLLGLEAGLAGARATEVVSCPAGQVRRARFGCVCRLTGRPPVGGVCPCPMGLSDTGDGRGCLECRSDGDCGVSDACTTYVCAGGACVATTTV